MFVERLWCLRRHQSELVIVRYHFRLEGGIVSCCNDAIGLPVPDCGCRFGHGHDATGALIRDAGIRPFELSSNTDVAKHVVGKVFQQPHRRDHVAQLRSKFWKRSFGFGNQRKVVIIAGIVAAARTNDQSGTVVEWLLLCVLQCENFGVLNRLIRRVNSEHVGSGYCFVQFSIRNQRPVVLLHFGRDFNRPLLAVPL